ncbi:XrtB/PEP-CTERM-associated polysaccharide biosynthesis outer membrane protein EpsL [Thauera sinica]|uniref:XrtB/PEP-CTERM-associated polysaccharide biosynthesis outer membrane protein EpsL n=1 Tax=Thauera sinica TaxID=2665146 RepID=A0ABW1ANI2_9RHOO|nr:XrtB/PEP-CTERM-associated polysaccharide biosynthesis outer membrane protein EpsL [Thauera sp. K11]
MPLLAVLASAFGTARADEADALNFELSQTFYYDSNLYRLPDGFAAPKGERHDTVSITTAGIVFDRAYSRQRLRASLAMSSNRYAVHDDLDYDSPAAQLSWNWQLGNRWSGLFSYQYSETLGGFEDYGTTNRSLSRYSRGSASADYWLHPDWAVGAGASKTANNYDEGLSVRDESETNAYDLNVTYRPSTGNRVVLTLRNTDGLYPNRPDIAGALRRYTQREARVNADWRLTGALRVSGYIGETRRSYEREDNRGFEGLTGRLAFDWLPTGKTSVNLGWRREIGADEDVFANYAVTEVLSLAPTWRATSKLVVGANWERRQRDYGGDPRVLPDSVRRPDRSETTYRYGVNLSYQAARNVALSLSYARQERDVELATRRYSADTVFLSGSLSF